MEILACPNATNMFWQARCKPKIVMPPRKTGMAQLTVSISRVSLVNARAIVSGKSIMTSMSARLNENMMVRAM